jgi:ribonuclease Z
MTTGRQGFSRRDTLKMSGLALGGLALGGGPETQQSSAKGKGLCEVGRCYPTSYKTTAYTYFEHLPLFDPGTPVDPDEMRISFMGSEVPPTTRSQKLMSIFVQVGSGDQAVFDCGSGVCANYGAMGVKWSEMNKIFISHLHGDHMSDLSFIYQSGPQGDRKTPLFVFGPGPSGFIWPGPDPSHPTTPYGAFDDGTKTFCEMFRAMLRWQSEGFCFQSTGVKWGSGSALDPSTLREDWGLPVDPVAVRDPRAPWVARYNDADYVDDFNDGYAVVPIELPYKTVGGQAYFNERTKLKISHYPVVHTRAGAIGFKVEWNGLSMIYSSDTKPEWNSVRLGDGVDVYIHEMAVPPEIWAMKISGLSVPGEGMDPAEWDRMVEWTQRVQDSSHTTPGAFGYMLSQMHELPRVVVPTHFPTTDDTVNCALKSVQAHVPTIGRLGEKIVWSYDLMVFRVYKDRIVQCRALVDDYSMKTTGSIPAEDQADPKYFLYDASGHKSANPTGQLDPDAEIIPATDRATGAVNYRDDGY